MDYVTYLRKIQSFSDPDTENAIYDASADLRRLIVMHAPIDLLVEVLHSRVVRFVEEFPHHIRTYDAPEIQTWIRDVLDWADAISHFSSNLRDKLSRLITLIIRNHAVTLPRMIRFLEHFQDLRLLDTRGEGYSSTDVIVYAISLRVPMEFVSRLIRKRGGLRVVISRWGNQARSPKDDAKYRIELIQELVKHFTPQEMVEFSLPELSCLRMEERTVANVDLLMQLLKEIFPQIADHQHLQTEFLYQFIQSSIYVPNAHQYLQTLLSPEVGFCPFPILFQNVVELDVAHEGIYQTLVEHFSIESLGTTDWLFLTVVTIGACPEVVKLLIKIKLIAEDKPIDKYDAMQVFLYMLRDESFLDVDLFRKVIPLIRPHALPNTLQFMIENCPAMCTEGERVPAIRKTFYYLIQTFLPLNNSNTLLCAFFNALSGRGADFPRSTFNILVESGYSIRDEDSSYLWGSKGRSYLVEPGVMHTLVEHGFDINANDGVFHLISCGMTQTDQTLTTILSSIRHEIQWDRKHSTNGKSIVEWLYICDFEASVIANTIPELLCAIDANFIRKLALTPGYGVYRSDQLTKAVLAHGDAELRDRIILAPSFLFTMAATGGVDRIEELWTYPGLDWKAKDEYGYTLLDIYLSECVGKISVNRYSERLANKLVAEGVDITPFLGHIMVNSCFPPPATIIRHLQECGMNFAVSTSDQHKRESAFAASISLLGTTQRTIWTRYMIENYRNEINVNETFGPYNRSALHILARRCEECDLWIFDFLLSHPDIQPNLRDNAGDTFLMALMRVTHSNARTAVLKHVLKLRDDYDLTATNQRGATVRSISKAKYIHALFDEYEERTQRNKRMRIA